MPRSRRTRDMRDSIPGTSKNPNFVVILRCSEIFIAYISKYMLRSKISSRLVSLPPLRCRCVEDKNLQAGRILNF